MSHRNPRGRYGMRSSNASNAPAATAADSYSPAYSTQAGYNQSTTQQSTPQSQPYTRQQQATAIKQEYDTPKREDYQSAQATPKKAASPPPADAAMVQDDEKSEKPWKKRSFQKLPKKVKKKRLNAKLRNLLAPKNAMMVLHELHPGLTCTKHEETTNSGQTQYSVVIEIDGKQFKGQGLSKAQAKQTACESALKAALFEKMAQSNAQKAAEVQEMDTSETVDQPVGSPGANGDAASDSGKTARKPPEEDDVPWGSLASYALFRLFSEWQAQGYTLPTSNKIIQPSLPANHSMVPMKKMTPDASQRQPITQSPPPPANHTMMPMKKMPTDASQRHPVQLLNQLKPHAQYSETREGNPPNMVFTFTVTFDGQSYSGLGPNKKDAKKTCAKNALKNLGIQYEDN